MKQKNGKELHLTGWAAAAALAFSFVVMPPLLAAAPVEAAVQTVPGNETVLYADDKGMLQPLVRSWMKKPEQRLRP